MRMDGRAVECNGLENRRGLTSSVSSNLTPSAIRDEKIKRLRPFIFCLLTRYNQSKQRLPNLSYPPLNLPPPQYQTLDASTSISIYIGIGQSHRHRHGYSCSCSSITYGEQTSKSTIFSKTANKLAS